MSDTQEAIAIWKVFENTKAAPMKPRYNGTSREDAMRAYEACEHGFFQGQTFDGTTYTQFERAMK